MILYFDCFSGASGDMILGALLDAGLSLDRLEQELAKLEITGLKIIKKKVEKGGISGTKFEPEFPEEGHRRRQLKDIMSLIDQSALSTGVKERARQIFTRLAEAEAAVHGKTSEGVHFHEIGDIDSIVDVVAVCVAIEELNVEEIHVSALRLGRGFVKTRHGTLPVPCPATLELVKGFPVEFSNISAELITPTGAAILTTLAKTVGGPMPLIRSRRIGYGAGTRDLEEQPNFLRVVMGEKVFKYEQDEMLVVETTIDDMNPVQYEYVFESLFKAGAVDVYLVPVHMKKSRPGIVLTTLVARKDFANVAEAVFRETTTTGIRYFSAPRVKLPRRKVEIDTKYGKVNIKAIERLGRKVGIPEYEDCKRIAKDKKLPFSVVYEEVKETALKVDRL